MVPQTQITEKKIIINELALVLFWPLQLSNHLDPYSRTSYDISWALDWSRWPSRPIRSLRYIVTCTIIWACHPANPEVYQMLAWCWASVVDHEPRSSQHLNERSYGGTIMRNYVPAFAMVSPQINQGWLIVRLTWARHFTCCKRTPLRMFLAIGPSQKWPVTWLTAILQNGR